MKERTCTRRRYPPAKLEDFDNACSAYEKAIDMESDHLFHLNFAVTLLNGWDFFIFNF